MSDDIVEKILNDPQLLKEFFQQEVLNSSSLEKGMSDALQEEWRNIQVLTVDRKKEIEEQLKSRIQGAINRGELHRYSGFLNDEKS